MFSFFRQKLESLMQYVSGPVADNIVLRRVHESLVGSRRFGPHMQPAHRVPNSFLHLGPNKGLWRI